MSRLAIVAGGAIAALAVAVPAFGVGSGPASTTNGGGASACRPAGSRTIVESRHVRVFRWRRIAYGCLHSRGVRVRLVETGEFDEADLAGPRPRIAGRFVGFAYSWSTAAAGGDGVSVVDLRNGRSRGIELDATEDPSVSTADLVVTRRGSLAWTWTADVPEETVRLREVRKLEPGDRGQLGVLLDSGSQLDLDSLERRGSRVAWVNAGQRRSAPLR